MSTSKRARVPSTCSVVHAREPVEAVGRRGGLGVIDVRVRWRSSCERAVSTVRPARMMLTRSHSASTSARMWLESSTVRPRRALVLRRTSWNTASISGSSPEVGSSRISSSTSEASAATSATFWRLPLEYARPFFVRVELEALEQLVAARGVEPAAQPAEQVDHLAAGEVRPQVTSPGT